MSTESFTHIIIINYRTWQLTVSCLRSLLRSNYKNFKVWLAEVENHEDSLRNIGEFLELHREINFEIIALNKNNGFAAANNAVLKILLDGNENEFVWLLNNDTTVLPDSLSELVSGYQKLRLEQKRPGIIGPKIIYVNNTIQFAGGIFNPKKGPIKFIGFDQQDKGQFDNQIREVDYVMGASMFLSIAVLKKIGLMDERYFLYCEDIDWCITASRQGYRNYFYPSSTVIHYQGGSTGIKYSHRKKPPETLQYLHSSYLQLYRKFYKAYLPVAYFQLLRSAIRNLTKGNFTETRAICRAIINSIQ